MLIFSVMDIDEKMEDIEKTGEETAEEKVYEVGYLLSSGIAEEAVPGEAVILKEIIENHGGKVLSEDWPKMRRLAYPILKIYAGKKTIFENAYFGWVKFEGPNTFINKIKSELEKNANVIRFIIIKTVAENTLAPIRERSFGVRSVAAGKIGDKEHAKSKKPVLDEKMDEEIEKLVIE